MIRLVEVPEIDGQTMFADGARAYDALSPELKRRIENLEAKVTWKYDLAKFSGRKGFWQSVRPATEADGYTPPKTSVVASMAGKYPSVVHPLVITHPETGRKILFFTPTWVDCVLGLSQEESDALMVEITDHMLSPEFIYSHEWTLGDALMWDNLRVLHAANGNPPEMRRKALITTLKGSLRTGRYFDPAASAPAEHVAMA